MNSTDYDKWDSFCYNNPYGNIFKTRKMADVWNQKKRRESKFLITINVRKSLIRYYRGIS